MADKSFEDKFIAFVDLIGFKALIEQAERSEGRSLDEVREVLRELARQESKDFFKKHGPMICPYSACIHNHLSFQITQVGGCAVISAEVSPAGIINLIDHCRRAAIRLLNRGVMVRGYIMRGYVVHDDTTLIKPGHQNAGTKEEGVTAFKKRADENGTPFMEVEQAVFRYIENQDNACVRGMFSRMVASDWGVSALFPFRRLSHSFFIGGFGLRPFNPEKEKQNNAMVRLNIRMLIERVNRHVARDNPSALRKTRHYVAALEEQLRACDLTDGMIDRLFYPIVLKT